jgi:hypothetical protein
MAVTVTTDGNPTLAEDGAVTAKWVVASTVTSAETPVIEGLIVSVAVTVWGPTVFRVTAKVPVPLVRALSGGRMAAPSLLVIWTVPA